jgi:hypothetical protein
MSTPSLLSKKVNLVLKSDTVLEISREVAELSARWRTILQKGQEEDAEEEDSEEESDEEESKEHILEIIDLRLDSDIVKKVVDFLIYHKVHPYQSPNKPLVTNDIKKVMLDKWDAEYLDVTPKCIRLLVDAAYYLGIPSLIDATIVKISCQIKGYTDLQARKWFGLDVMDANSETILA